MFINYITNQTRTISSLKVPMFFMHENISLDSSIIAENETKRFLLEKNEKLGFVGNKLLTSFKRDEEMLNPLLKFLDRKEEKALQTSNLYYNKLQEKGKFVRRIHKSELIPLMLPSVKQYYSIKDIRPYLAKVTLAKDAIYLSTGHTALRLKLTAPHEQEKSFSISHFFLEAIRKVDFTALEIELLEEKDVLKISFYKNNLLLATLFSEEASQSILPCHHIDTYLDKFDLEEGTLIPTKETITALIDYDTLYPLGIYLAFKDNKCFLQTKQEMEWTSCTALIKDTDSLLHLNTKYLASTLDYLLKVIAKDKKDKKGINFSFYKDELYPHLNFNYNQLGVIIMGMKD